MSLYDDLGVAASDTKTEGWSKNFKLLQSQLKVKKAALTQAKVGTCNAVKYVDECEYFLVSLVLCDSKLNIFGLWTKQDI